MIGPVRSMRDGQVSTTGLPTAYAARFGPKTRSYEGATLDRAGLITAAYSQAATLVIGAALGLGIAHLVDGSKAIGAIAGGAVGVIVGFAYIIRTFQDAMHEFDDIELPPAAGDDDGAEE